MSDWSRAGQGLLKGPGQLVGTRCGLEPATHTAQLHDDILGFLTLDQPRDADRVARTAALKLHMVDAMLIVEFKCDGL